MMVYLGMMQDVLRNSCTEVGLQQYILDSELARRSKTEC